jgi:hypothetical protein
MFFGNKDIFYNVNVCFIGVLLLCIIQTVWAAPFNPISSPHDAENTEFRFKVLEEALSKKADRGELEAALSMKADKPDLVNGFTTKIDGRIFFDSYHFSGDRQSNTPLFRND